MNGTLYSFFINDHRRLESLLNKAVQTSEQINLSVYSEFRAGLLRHIGIEEKILMPMIKKNQNGVPYSSADALRLEHGALAALLVPSPNKKIIAALRAILHHHNEREECANCLYALCENLFKQQIDEVMNEILSYPPVPVAPHVNTTHAHEAARRALARAGYNFDQYEDE